MTVQPTYVGDGCTDGEVLGRSGGKAGFYGIATPIVQPSGAAQAAVATTAITTLATTPTATDIAIAVNSLIARQSANITLVNGLRSALVNLNLIAGA